MTANNKLKLVVLFGGRSGEHEVSLNSSRSVLTVLDPVKYEVFEVGITHEGAWLTGKSAHQSFVDGKTESLTPCTILPDPSRPGLYTISASGMEKLTNIDVIVPVLHGTFGEDGALQGLLELTDLAYVGAGVTGASVGMDKGIFKDVMRANDIPVVEGVLVRRSEIERNLQAVISRVEALGAYPFFTKPANLGSSVGVSKCNNRSDLQEGLIEAATYDRRVLIERGVSEPREVEISVLGNDDPQASIPGEIKPSREFYSYESKYEDGTSGLLIPAPLSDEVTAQLRQIAVKAYKAIDCAGMARVDFLMEKDSSAFYLNEINTIPGFTTISMYPKLWEASGLSYAALVDRLIELALERKAERDRTEHQFRRDA